MLFDMSFRTFATLMATMNVLPVLPLALGLADHAKGDAQALLVRALAVGVGAGAVLTVIGDPLLSALTITEDDLRVAGGFVLLVFAIYDLLFSKARRSDASTSDDAGDIGIVPLGVPILVGPAGFTALPVASRTTGAIPTLTALVPVALLNLAILLAGGMLVRHIGRPALRVVGKVSALLLAALAVSMIRIGIQGMILH